MVPGRMEPLSWSDLWSQKWSNIFPKVKKTSPDKLSLIPLVATPALVGHFLFQLPWLFRRYFSPSIPHKEEITAGKIPNLLARRGIIAFTYRIDYVAHGQMVELVYRGRHSLFRCLQAMHQQMKGKSRCLPPHD